ncbi:MAG: PEP-CTERM sorting domain-containing protein [Verrucomicrobiaceae bacterium]|nr:MAG: PEP-CTERM sorting domain-containing protein [Verrucomicrobiaceae bacterium]
MLSPRFLVPLLALAGLPVEAALLVYDGYSYSGEGSAISGAMPGTSTVGLNRTVVYQGAVSNNYTYNSAGLSFGSLITTGGSMNFGVGTNAITGTISLGTGIAPYAGATVYTGGTSYSGTLYSSYLIKLNKAPNGSTAFQSRVADSIVSSNARYIAAADSRIGSTNAPSLAYDGSDTSTTTVTASTGAALGTTETYLVVSRYTNAGTTASAVDQATATLFVLSLAQFNTMLSSGQPFENYLDGADASALTARIEDKNSTTNNNDFADGRFAGYLAISTNSTSGSTGIVDETRYGTTMDDVIPVVPEPSTVALLLLAAPLFGRRNRRR